MNKRKIQAQVRPSAQWWSIRNSTDGGPTVVSIYDEIGWLGTNASGFFEQLRAIDSPEIELRLNSPGGDVFDGIAIFNALRSHPARVTTYVDSLAASIASVIALAGDHVVAMPFSQMMIHEAHGVCLGNAGDMEQMAALLARQSDNIAAIYNDKAGGGIKTWRSRMRDETWFTAQEALEAGLVDEIARVERQEDRPAARWDLSVFTFAGRENAPAPGLLASAASPSGAGATAEASEATTRDGASDADPSGTESGRVPDGPELQWNPDAVRAAMRAAVTGVPFDADAFRATLAGIAAEAPAVPDRRPEPIAAQECGDDHDFGIGDRYSSCVACGAERPEPEPEPGQLVAESIAAVAADAPAVPLPPEPPPPPPEPEPAPAPVAQLTPQEAWRIAVAPLVTAAIELAANDAPAPPAPRSEPEPERIAPDGVVVARAMREAVGATP